MIRKASQHLRRGMGIQDHEDKHLLLHILDPSFLIQVLRILAQSAAQVGDYTTLLSCLVLPVSAPLLNDGSPLQCHV